MTDVSTFDKIRIGIASPEQVRAWSCGEVKKPETINYRTFKPERDGLFCERIFGPVKDWECHCGRYKKVKFKGIVCDRCGVEVTRSKVRRERMGHIELAAPVCHIWYLKGVPSPLSLILDISPRPLEKVIYFASYIVTKVDRARINSELDDIRAAVSAEIEAIREGKEDAIAIARRSSVKDLKSVGEPISAAEEAELQAEEEAARAEAEAIEEVEPEMEAEPVHDEDAAPEGESDEEEEVLEEAEEVPEPMPSPEEIKKQLADRIKVEERDAADRTEEITQALKLIETAEKKQLITEDQYRAVERLMDILGERLGRDMTGVVTAGLGAAAIKELLGEIDVERLARELRQEISNTQGPKRARAIKRLEVVEAFINSKSRPDWMIFEAVPVISPELRPMVQLDGGRFATSDLNDLYRRIINRNNRLKKIIDIRAPESIINHEKRLLQEAVDALIDNGRRTRPVVGSNNRPLKSLSDMLKGKEGRFRKNLLGKRVDYSGRSVIVVGPNLKLHQCGLPKEMALELFKPFVMKALVEKNYTSNIKTAKRMIDRMKPEVWDALEEVISEHPVMLNRAPTLHRLGIQAFEPILVDGKAIQIHPLVCHAFNADFDGDQMAVHVPLSSSAQAEARILMLATHNLFSPADGHPIAAPIQDIVLGLYYASKKREGDVFPEIFSSEDEAILAYELGKVDLHHPIKVRIRKADGESEIRELTVGRLIVSQVLPEEMRPVDKVMNKKVLSDIVTECHRLHGSERTIQLLDELKTMGFKYATQAGITISMTDMDIPAKREEIIAQTEEAVDKTNQQYRRGLITQGERKQKVLELWTKAAEDVAEAILENIDNFNPIFMITDSGARGSLKQITQLSGMRGLMSDPFSNLIEDLPIKSNFHEGLSVLEYFISTHGARKGLADTALRTADAGYLTRRLVDVAQDVIIRDDDCGTTQGIYVAQIVEEGDIVETVGERIKGRSALEAIADPNTGEILVEAGEEISDRMAKQIEELGIKRVGIRSPLFCESRQGICASCYGRDMSSGKLCETGTAVGIIAAQSIGEPGTQITMKTFHTGGIAGKYLTGVAEVKKKKQESLRELHDDIRRGLISLEEDVEGMERERVRAVQAVLKVLEDQVRGLLRVVELFEARKPKGQAIITEVAGEVVDIETKGLKRVVIHSKHDISETAEISGEALADNILNADGEVAFAAGTDVTDKVLRKLKDMEVKDVTLRKTYLVPYRGNLEVNVGSELEAGDRLTEGPLDPHKVLDLRGVRGVVDYLTREIQSVYRAQGVSINDKHIEVIIRQMLKRRKIRHAGDAKFLPGQIVDKFAFEEENTRVREMDPPGTEATADWVLLGITEASLATDSFLSAASFQKTTRVLTDAAVKGKRDNLVGLKENVIIGRLIPAGTGLPVYRAVEVEAPEGKIIPRAQISTREAYEAGQLLAVPNLDEEESEPEASAQYKSEVAADGGSESDI
ncbi:MAG TPA: DNA-directed RNA polymerase subunit beta' [Armatimonadota bacterium]|nr:DNA-directed RNA polymerase subunit beta' [Armatimonadota bacterium]